MIRVAVRAFYLHLIEKSMPLVFNMLPSTNVWNLGYISMENIDIVQIT